MNPHKDPRTLLEPVTEGDSPDSAGLDLRVARHPNGPPPGLREAVMASSGAPMEVSHSACPSLAAEVLGVSPGMVRVGRGVPQLLEVLLSHRLRTGGRVALAEPGPGGVTQTVLDAGASYIDLGRTHQWELQTESLERVLEDGDASMVFLGRPTVPAGRLATLATVRDILDRGMDVVVDESHLTWSRRPETPVLETSLRNHPHLWVLRCAGAAWGLGELGVGLLVGSEEGMEGVPLSGSWDRAREAALVHLLETRPGLTPWAANLRGARDALVEVTTGIMGLSIGGEDGPGVLVGRPGWDGQSVQRLLSEQGILTLHSAHWSHRDHVYLGAPDSRQLPQVTEALTALSEA